MLRYYGNGEYLTDVLTAKAVNFIGTRTAEHPFLAVVAPPSAHAPFMPAARHRGRFRDLELLQTPNFNVASDVLGTLMNRWKGSYFTLNLIVFFYTQRQALAVVPSADRSALRPQSGHTAAHQRQALANFARCRRNGCRDRACPRSQRRAE